jgi:hypothetical protein
MNSILAEIGLDLKNSADEKTKQTFQRFLKKQVKYYVD